MYDCIICARGNSKGIPGKNLKKLWGKSLIELCVEKAKRSKEIRHIYVSTEDEKIALQAELSGATRVIFREKYLSYDHVRQVEVIKHLLTNLDDKCEKLTEVCFLLQTTTPFITTLDIDQAAANLKVQNAQQLLSIHSTKLNPTSLYLKEGNKITPLYQNKRSKQRQIQPSVLEANGGIRMFNIEYLLEKGEIFDEETYILGYEIPSERSLNLDEMADWYKAVKVTEGN